MANISLHNRFNISAILYFVLSLYKENHSPVSQHSHNFNIVPILNFRTEPALSRVTKHDSDIEWPRYNLILKEAHDGGEIPTVL